MTPPAHTFRAPRARAAALGAALLSMFAAPPESRASAPAADVSDPVALYGDEIRFDVLRNGVDAGFHTVRFAKAEDGLRVAATFQLEVQFLFFTAFRYVYRSEALWRDGGLARLDVAIDDGGTARSLHAVAKGGRLFVTAPDAAFDTDAGLLPTNHWNAGVLTQDRVLNTLTGRVNQVRIEPQGDDAVSTEQGTRFRYTGDLDTEVWYDNHGRWVKMRFTGRDGSTIDYVCRRCQGPSTKGAGQ